MGDDRHQQIAGEDDQRAEVRTGEARQHDVGEGHRMEHAEGQPGERDRRPGREQSGQPGLGDPAKERLFTQPGQRRQERQSSGPDAPEERRHLRFDPLHQADDRRPAGPQAPEQGADQREHGQEPGREAGQVEPQMGQGRYSGEPPGGEGEDQQPRLHQRAQQDDASRGRRYFARSRYTPSRGFTRTRSPSPMNSGT